MALKSASLRESGIAELTAKRLQPCVDALVCDEIRLLAKGFFATSLLTLVEVLPSFCHATIRRVAIAHIVVDFVQNCSMLLFASE